MLTDEKILLLLEKLADGETGLQRLFYSLGFDVQNSPLATTNGEDWVGALRTQPRLVAIEDHSRLTALWFSVRDLNNDVQKKVRRHYGTWFPAVLFLFETKDHTWAWELSTPSITASCSFHLSQINQPLLHLVRSLYLAHDEILDISRLTQVGQALNLVGTVETSATPSHKAPWKPLTATEERELAYRIEQGGKDGLVARNALVEANLRLVTKNAKRYLYCGMDMQDLIQEGTVGLIRAAEKFDWRRGFRFSTYATYWIRQALGRTTENSSRTIRLPSYLQETIYRVLREQHRLRSLLRREPTADELSAATNRTIKQVFVALDAIDMEPLSIDQPLSGVELHLREIIPAPAHFQPEQLATAGATREAIEQSFELLSKREKEVLLLRFGFDQPAIGGRTLEEVGQTLQLSRERARQIEAGALQKLREKPAGACLRATVLGLDEELPKPTPQIEGASRTRKVRASRPDQQVAWPEIPDIKKESENLPDKEQEQSEQAAESIVPELIIEETVITSPELELTLFSEEELKETAMSSPETQPDIELVCKECGFPVETKPTIGGKYYRCKHCKNVGWL